ncbi:PREDICTED: uncharacterized protein LOC105448392 [Wasmannia auropunctata]|uniref:uncharacterized protein LOC105448392 n=1 Tax=Wasmannia auropunctata TaxID=64793 RepID=UPI0005EF9504|nr:PREDICTED: uncharacterized protein LOC105448392 [Wasmannia auropunctata]
MKNIHPADENSFLEALICTKLRGKARKDFRTRSIRNFAQFKGEMETKNFIEGNRVLKAEHIIKIGKNAENVRGDCVNLTALCLQTSHLKQSPHEITGKVRRNREVVSMKCSCKAGLGEKCKHIIAALLYCSRYDFENFETLSCTDQPCKWKKVLHEQALTQYVSAPLKEHDCLLLQARILERLPDSAFTKRTNGRHSPVTFEGDEKKEVTSAERKAIEIIFKYQDSDTMKKIRGLNTNKLQPCCIKTLETLVDDFIKICVDTKLFYADWHKERRFRVTGSTCYGLYTYTKNKNPNWKKKCGDHFTPKSFKSEFTEYRKMMENQARNTFKNITKKQVFEIGLIVSKLNPWLAYSPNAIIFKDKKPSELLEIKCPFKGKTMIILDVVETEVGKSLMKKFGKIQLKKKHRYYGQVQLRMAVVNVKKTSFVMYASFDRSIFILDIEFNQSFVTEMLTAIKNMYYSVMLLEICLLKNIENIENIRHNS